MKASLPIIKDLYKPSSTENGQSLIEFVFLMASMILISFLLLKGFNSGIGKIWTTYVTAIAKPTPSDITLR
ncbi:MAG: hypothetical protein HN576_17010 [Bacteriovoracaceae bacterium]|jgi:hypothetical protein|nr:hypothetical protein [Bacteriovoracaceae bacterium]